MVALLHIPYYVNQHPQLFLAHSPAYSLPHFVLRAPMIQPYLTRGVCGCGELCLASGGGRFQRIEEGYPSQVLIV